MEKSQLRSVSGIKPKPQKLVITLTKRCIGAIAAFFGLSNRMANLTAMRPNDEFYLMGRVPKAR